MSLWLVRAGRYGEREDFAVSNNVAVVGWDEVPDLRLYTSKDALAQSLNEIYPGEKQRKLKHWEGMLWRFSHELARGNIVALPLKAKPAVIIGEVTGEYEYNDQNPDGAKHFIPVHWLKEIPRKEIDNDLRYSFGSLLTVCEISRNNAEARIRAKLAGENGHIENGEAELLEEELDIEQITQDQIMAHIDQKYKGHELAQLVGDLLIAQGYHVRVSPAALMGVWTSWREAAP